MRLLFLFLFLFFFLGAQFKEESKKLSFLYNQRKLQQAISLCRNKLNSLANKFYYLNLALLYEEKEDLSEAISLLKKAHLKYRKDKDLIFHLARLYFLSSQEKESIYFFRKYLKYQPKDKRAYFYLGLNYEELKDFKRARASYRKALKIDPYFVLSLIRLSDLYIREGRVDKALVLLEKLKKIEPSIASLYKKLAFLYFKKGRYFLSFREASRYREMRPLDKEINPVLGASREKLGEEFFKEKRKQLLLARRKKKVKVFSFVKGKIPLVRVCIAKGISNFEFKLNQEAILYSRDVPVFKLEKDSLYSISLTSEGYLKLQDEEGRTISSKLSPSLKIKKDDPFFLIGVFGLKYARGEYWARDLDGFFRGSLVVRLNSHSLLLINILNLEEYLYGVLPSEVSSSWPKEALASQAIVARTKALKSLNPKEDYDFLNTYSFQVYRGANKESKIIQEAVDATRGLILVDKKGSPLEVYYSSNCGGHTQGIGEFRGVLDAEEEIKGFPLSPFELYEWLSKEPEVFCKTEGFLKSRFRWQRIYSKKDFFKILEKNLSLKDIKKIEILERNFSSHIQRVRIIAEDREKTISSEFKIRKVLDNLRSGLFYLETKYSKKKEPLYFIIWGGGFGHGRGLCQFGAKGMAERGYSYPEILQHYFPYAQLKKVY